MAILLPKMMGKLSIGEAKIWFVLHLIGCATSGKETSVFHDDRLGYLTFCPTNLGTAIRASVHIKLPKISKNIEEFNKIAAKYNLQVRGTAGEHSDSGGGIYDVSNKRRMGLTEFQAVKEIYDGVVELIKLEIKSQ